MIPQIVQDHWLVLAVAGFIIGLDKGGIKPLIIVAIYLITSIMEPSMMLAALAPVMFIGDIFPAIHYRKDTNIAVVLRFLPWVTVGLAVGALIGMRLSEQVFGVLVAGIILVMSLILTRLEFRPSKTRSASPGWISAGLGPVAGFSSIIGNIASGVTNIYFLLFVHDKRSFIGSNAILYLTLNGMKLIIYALFWKVISPETLGISISLVLPIILGTVLATYIVKLFPEKVFRIIILCSAYYAGIAMLVRYL